jgi:probable DNA metabolism protein
MRVVALASEDDFEGWRDAARALAQARVPPDQIVWQIGEAPADLFGDEAVLEPAAPAAFRVPRPFLNLAQAVVLHSDPQRFALLYTLLVGLIEQPRRIDDAADPLVRRLEEMAKAVRRDVHKMRAFVRFREVEDIEGARYIAWFEPEHHIVRANARFFVDRFTSMRWSILTPELSLHWDRETLAEGPGASKADAPGADPVEDVWKTYYASIFNPSRLKTGAMLKEMPRKYWKNMPETALVKELVAGAQARETAMVQTARTSRGGNSAAAWAALRDEAKDCTRCHLYKHATQTVFGEGPVDARMMFVGEQPGDQEDLAGRPFVGPAGQMFDKAIGQAGIDRAAVYVTNAVKHFKFVPAERGKRRIHKTPSRTEVVSCRPWLIAELEAVCPDVLVLLGATAAKSLLGNTFRLTEHRGEVLRLPDDVSPSGLSPRVVATMHPSAVLRGPQEAREESLAALVADLQVAARLLGA